MYLLYLIPISHPLSLKSILSYERLNLWVTRVITDLCRTGKRHGIKYKWEIAFLSTCLSQRLVPCFLAYYTDTVNQIVSSLSAIYEIAIVGYKTFQIFYILFQLFYETLSKIRKSLHILKSYGLIRIYDYIIHHIPIAKRLNAYQSMLLFLRWNH